MERLRTRALQAPTGLAPVYDSQPGGPDEAVLFLHGNPGPMDDFEALFPGVEPLARVVALDMPNFGRAADVELRDHEVSTYAEHLGAVIDTLGLRRVHLVLHDFGGIWGLSWASQHPEQVASLTLINTGFLRGYRWHFFGRIWKTPLLGPLFQRITTGAAIRFVMQRDNPRPLPDAFIDRVLSHATRKQKLRVASIYRAARDPDGLADAQEAGLRRIDAPVCVIWGAEDVYVPVSQIEPTRDVFPQAEVHCLEGLGHWPFIDDPGAVQAVLLPFLRRVASTSSARPPGQPRSR